MEHQMETRTRARRKKERGQTLAEFAMIAPILVILIFGFVDIARLYHAWVTIQGSAREGARYGVTGRTDCAIASDDRLACIEYVTAKRADKLTNDATNLDVSVRSWDYPAYADPATDGDPGEQCDALEVVVEYDFTPSTPLVESLFGAVQITGAERLVNEPFGTCS
jgi:Flp pilus assembly protein TadG